MFFTKLKLRDEKTSDVIHDNVEEDRPTAVKPMNCPGHVLVYAVRPHSHNEFPLRIAEMGLVPPARTFGYAARALPGPKRSHRTTRTTSARRSRSKVRSAC